MFKFSDLDLDNQNEELKEYYNDLRENICDIEDCIDELELEIESKNELELEIEKLTSKLNFLRNKVKKNETKLSKLKEELLQKKRELEELQKIMEEERIKKVKIEAFQDYVLDMKTENTFVYGLSSNTSTVKLLDKYCAYKKDFLVLLKQLRKIYLMMCLLMEKCIQEQEKVF